MTLQGQTTVSSFGMGPLHTRLLDYCKLISHIWLPQWTLHALNILYFNEFLSLKQMSLRFHCEIGFKSCSTLWTMALRPVPNALWHLRAPLTCRQLESWMSLSSWTLCIFSVIVFVSRSPTSRIAHSCILVKQLDPAGYSAALCPTTVSSQSNGANVKEMQGKTSQQQFEW